jgi:hypothetical protein
MPHILEDVIETQSLTLITLQMLTVLGHGQQPPRLPYQFSLENDFQEALPHAYRLIQLSKEFLKQKQAEKDAEAERYWASPEGQKRRAEIMGRFKEKEK